MITKSEPQGAIIRRRIVRLVAGAGVIVGVLAISGTVLAASPAPGNTGLPGVSTGVPATAVPAVPAGGAPSTPATGGGASGSQTRKSIPATKTVPALNQAPVTQP
jgi:hypothetical protein